MPTTGELLAVIDLHGEVTELGLDLPGVMDLVVRKVLDLVQARGGHRAGRWGQHGLPGGGRQASRSWACGWTGPAACRACALPPAAG
jgi:hypothetical protein